MQPETAFVLSRAAHSVFIIHICNNQAKIKGNTSARNERYADENGNCMETERCTEEQNALATVILRSRLHFPLIREQFAFGVEANKGLILAARAHKADIIPVILAQEYAIIKICKRMRGCEIESSGKADPILNLWQ